jgi:hypothetical protein
MPSGGGVDLARDLSRDDLIEQTLDPIAISREVVRGLDRPLLAAWIGRRWR